MQVLVLGLNYRRTPLALRERLAFPPSEFGDSLEAMQGYVSEGAILSTCQRVELYAAASNVGWDESLHSLHAKELKRFWSKRCGVPVEEFESYLYCLAGREAVEHLFTVSCGLDSAIFGEPQILGQVREALRRGLVHGSMGRVLSALFRQAITTGKRARTETGIGLHAASLSSAAVDLARQTLGDLRCSRVVLVGTGKMGQLVARNLQDKDAAEIAVVGRRLGRAEQLALRCGSAVALSQLEAALHDCDIVITCTSASDYVIRREMLERVMGERGGKPLSIIDVAVPRDVEPAAGEILGVHLYNIDDLESTVATNLKERQAEARKVVPIISEEAERFETWLATLSVVPTIVALRQLAEAIRQSELARASALLSRLPERDRQRIEALTLAIQKKLLHHPITLLRAHAGDGDGRATAQTVRELFGLDLRKGSSGGRR